MMIKSTGLSAIFALAASAFMIPPSMSADSISASTLETAGVNPLIQTVRLDTDASALIHGVEGTLPLTFTFAVNRQNPTELLLNGEPFYNPGHFFDAPVTESVSAIIEAAATPNSDIDYELRVSNYVFLVEPEISTPSGSLIPLTLQINGFGNTPVTGLPALKVNLFKQNDNSLLIISAEAGEIRGETSYRVDEITGSLEQACESWPSFCRWRDIVSEKFKGVSETVGNKISGEKPKKHGGCGGRKPKTHRPGHGDRLPTHITYRPGNPHPHYGHHPKEQKYSVLTIIIVWLVVLGLIGIPLGALVCLTTAALINKCFGWKRVEYTEVAQNEQDDDAPPYDARFDDEEKQKYVVEAEENDDPLPVYEAVEKEVVQ
ncbi:hypothetical protein M501DRAFT_1012573 [Patellaria atrata CBS 101060]|uniref:Uncharacterized protein n=1 Tax=Patellaria atrata CBS 101060 TaxID=1346257 RepID=A0A9P4SJ34_9PEZI|nr:hypothetical protein M501DRAFT_1012573 [Patellaria atrata CBS 101060]